VLIAFSAQAQDDNPCNCKGTDPKLQYRTKAKHEVHFSKYHKSHGIISPDVMMGWEETYKDSTVSITPKGKALKTPRKKHTPEDSLYTLEGFLYFIAIQDDCDYHMEIGPQDETAPRVVVELTTDRCSVQKQLLKKLKSLGHKIRSFKLRREFSPGIKCTVTGLGFYDGWHKPDAHGRAPTHHTSWELHPVQTITLQQ